MDSWLSPGLVIVYLKSVFLGIAFSESWVIGLILGAQLSALFEGNGASNALKYLFCTFLIIAIIVYGLSRNVNARFRYLYRSRRVDLLLLVAVGFFLSQIFGSFGQNWYFLLINLLQDKELMAVVLILILFGFLLSLRDWQLKRKSVEDAKRPYFLSDTERQNINEDLLGFSKIAEQFSTKVLNGGSQDSIVFGVDAPWGVGKSSFINFCQQYWNFNHPDGVIVYKFNPLRQQSKNGLLEDFVDGLVVSIQKEMFVPELRRVFSGYSRFIKGSGSISFFGLDFTSSPYTIDDAFDDLKMTINTIDRKLIIVVDDLDRLAFSEIKEVLYVIKKSFAVPNITYVICYDIENIERMESDDGGADKISEFLEKYINVKVSLFLNGKVLIDFVTKNLSEVTVDNFQADPILISKAVSGLKEIYGSPSSWRYIKFLGNIRRLKRLINTIVLLDLEQTDFDNSDFDSKDLVHLLLIYISYPNVFREIYNAETGGGRGLFSLVAPYEEYYPKGERDEPQDYLSKSFKNSSLYEDYKETIDGGARFLLDKVFDASSRLSDKSIGQMSQEVMRTYACFNGGRVGTRNLERYLLLIVNNAKPARHEQFAFFKSKKESVREGQSILEILFVDEFSTNEVEANHKHLWNIVVNSIEEFDSTSANNLIAGLVGSLQRYSLISIESVGLGLRDSLPLYLVKILDTIGWADSTGRHTDNTSQNIKTIAKRIYGEDEFMGQGVLDSLMAQEKGILGLFDSLVFRLFCCSDRGGDIFNLSRSLALHSDPDAQITGLVEDIVVAEMRELSQEVYMRFRTHYIDKNLNIFDEIDSLDLGDMCSDWLDFVQTEIGDGSLSQSEVDLELEKEKSRLKTFISYQIGNREVNSGVGCGFYDMSESKDEGGISFHFNKYLFGFCFNSKTNYKHFVDYILRCFSVPFGIDESSHLSLDQILKVLDKNILKDYWSSNKVDILEFMNEDLSRKVITINYSLEYSDGIDRMVKTLDGMLQSG